MPAALGRGGRTAVVAALFWAGLAAFFDRPAARADALRGTVEFNYTLSESENRAAGAQTVRTDVQSFSQRYRLDFDRFLYPQLRLRGGGFFERIESTLETGDDEIDSTYTRLSPYAEMSLGTPLYNAAAGYNRQEERQRGNGNGGSSRLIREIYSARAGWLPVDLPALNVQYTRTETFDPERVVRDSSQETFLGALSYQPVKTVDLVYRGVRNRTEERLGGVETRDTTHTGRIAYGDRLLAGRVLLNGNYNISSRHTEAHAIRGGEVIMPIPALTGYFALDDTPEGALDNVPVETREFTDGNLTTPAVNSPLVLPNASAPEEFTRRNLGLDLTRPDAEVSGLLVWVDGPLTSTEAGSFLWAVYVSANNEDWTLWQTVSPAPFGPFDNRFEVRFPRVRTRYVKVVVAPLAATAILRDPTFRGISVTELQAILTLPAERAVIESSSISHQLNVTSRARLLDIPNLFYDFALFYTRTEPNSFSRLFVSNGLSVIHRLNPWLAGSAQVVRDDLDEPGSRQTIHRISASLNATPLRTLSQTVVYSGRIEDVEGVVNVRNSVYMSNRAALYPGVDMLFNAGVSEGHRDDGEKTMSYQMNLGSELRPHPAMTWSLFGSADRSERSGGDRPESSSSTRRARASVAWNPLSAVSLFASVDLVEQQTENITLYNWSLNWSPLREGTLLMSFMYNEFLRPQQDGLDRVISPGLRWEIRRGTFLDLSYALLRSKTGPQEVDTRMFSANLQSSF